ncbi:hypothetical protein ACE14D_00870 [Streptomyces sp. Act-28]
MLFGPDASIHSREQLVVFLQDLHQQFHAGGHEWENNTLEAFLEALAAVASREVVYGLPPEPGVWPDVGVRVRT